jgi:hypothetical protein
MSDPPFPAADLETVFPVPIIGPWLGRLGFAADLLYNACTPTPIVWSYAAAIAGTRAIATLIKPFNLAETFTASLGKGRHHGFKRLAGGFSGRGLGYIQALEELGPNAELLKSAAWRAFIIPAELYFKAQWYLFVADVTTDFFVNWISQAYRVQGCSDPDHEWAQGTSGRAWFLGFDRDLYLTWEHTPGIVAVGPTAITPADMDLTVHLSISWGKPPVDLVPTTWATPLVFIDGEQMSQTGAFQWDDNNKVGTSTFGHITRSKHLGPHFIRFQVQWNPDGWMFLYSALAQITCTPNERSTLLEDP